MAVIADTLAPDIDALVETADTRCIQAAAFAVRVPGQGPEEKTDHILGLFADAVCGHLTWLAKRQKKELKKFLTEPKTPPYVAVNEGTLRGDGIPSSRWVVADRAASSMPGEVMSSVALVDMPWTADGSLRYRAEIEVNWLARSSNPSSPDGSSMLAVTRGYAWSTVSPEPPSQDLYLRTPMHALYEHLMDLGEVVDHEALGLSEYADMAENHVKALGGVESVLVHLEKDVRVAMVDAATSALEAGQDTDEALGRVWRYVLQSYPAPLWWQGRLAAEAQHAKDEVARWRTKAESAGFAAEVPAKPVESAVAGLKKQLEEAEEKLRRATDDYDEAERFLQEQLQMARDEAASLRRHETDLEDAKRRAEEAQRAAEEAKVAAEAREKTAGDTLKDLDREMSAKDNEIRRLAARVKDLEEVAESPANAPAETAGALRVADLEGIPRNLEEVLTLAEETWPDRLEVLPSAHESARRWSGRDLDRPWRALKGVAEVLWRVHFIERDPREMQVFANEAGFELIPSESQTVDGTPVYREARTFMWNGERTYMPAHIKVADGSSEVTVRLHFVYDEEAKKIVIGHLGKHLPNTRS